MKIGEDEGVRLLGDRFRAAGLDLVDGYAMEIAGKTVHLDGYDPGRKIGFEYVTTEAGDREELSVEVVAELERRMRLGELYVLLIDEREVSGAAVLERAADHFLAVMKAKGRLGGP
ncbi:MAG TPA: hypothetical protein VL400_06200 [Polyangiaceae bacterium]|jgi:hypothetical protein|nr:hypothetical protein [Polyangiaceae bacterium]